MTERKKEKICGNREERVWNEKDRKKKFAKRIENRKRERKCDEWE